MDANTGELRPGMRIGPYEVIEELSRGGMGIVCRVRHTLTGHELALKVMINQALSVNEVVRFEREAQALAQLNHPHIASIKDYKVESGRPYFAMDLVSGQSLEAWVQAQFRERSEGSDWRAVVTKVEAIAGALQQCHKLGLIHRDLKPANIMIEQDTERPVLIDFGLARQQSTGSVEDLAMSLTQSGEMLGTPAYMSPEQIEDASKVDAKTDVWALTAVLFYALAGRPAFAKGNVMALLSHILKDPAPAIDSLRSDLPDWLPRLLQRGFHKDREARLSLSEFQLALKQGELLEQPSKRDLGLGWGLVLGVLAVALVGLGLWVMKNDGASVQPVDKAPTKPPERNRPPGGPPVKAPAKAPVKAPVNAMTASEMLARLNNLEAWQALEAEERELIAKRVDKALGYRFEYQGTRSYECQKVKAHIARYKHRKTGIVFHLLPGGAYRMGTADIKAEVAFRQDVVKVDNGMKRFKATLTREQPQHRVTIPAFFMARAETTWGQWDLGIGETKKSVAGRNKYVPKTYLSFKGVSDWLAKSSPRFRLPSEAEWEYACRAGSSTRYFWGDTLKDLRCWYRANSDDKLKPYSDSRHCVNAFGLVNMLGNAAEFVADAVRPNYKRGPFDHRPHLQTSNSPPYYLARGGHSGSPFMRVRCANRSLIKTDSLHPKVGFRVAMSLPDLD